MATYDDIASDKGLTADEYRIWVRGQLDAIARELTAHAKALEELDKRLLPLEQLRAIVLGAGAVILAVTPMLWWLLTRAATLDKGPKP